MTLFDRFPLLGHGIKLALIGLFLGYILISVILGVDVVIQHNSEEERGWLSRILPDVLKYVPLILAFIGLLFPFLVGARSSSIHGSAGWATPKELARDRTSVV